MIYIAHLLWIIPLLFIAGFITGIKWYCGVKFKIKR